MIRNLTLIVIGALALAACKPETITGSDQPDPMASELANAAPVELPPEAVEGQPASTDLTAEGGFVLKGNATASTVNLTVPGKGAQACKG